MQHSVTTSGNIASKNEINMYPFLGYLHYDSLASTVAHDNQKVKNCSRICYN